MKKVLSIFFAVSLILTLSCGDKEKIELKWTKKSTVSLPDPLLENFLKVLQSSSDDTSEQMSKAYYDSVGSFGFAQTYLTEVASASLIASKFLDGKESPSGWQTGTAFKPSENIDGYKILMVSLPETFENILPIFEYNVDRYKFEKINAGEGFFKGTETNKIDIETSLLTKIEELDKEMTKQLGQGSDEEGDYWAESCLKWSDTLTWTVDLNKISVFHKCLKKIYAGKIDKKPFKCEDDKFGTDSFLYTYDKPEDIFKISATTKEIMAKNLDSNPPCYKKNWDTNFYIENKVDYFAKQDSSSTERGVFITINSVQTNHTFEDGSKHEDIFTANGYLDNKGGYIISKSQRDPNVYDPAEENYNEAFNKDGQLTFGKNYNKGQWEDNPKYKSVPAYVPDYENGKSRFETAKKSVDY